MSDYGDKLVLSTCQECGVEAPKQSMDRWWEPGPDDGGDIRFHRAGWRTACRDQARCTERIAQAQAAEAAARSVREQVKADQRRSDADALAQQQTELATLLQEHGCDTSAGYTWDARVLASRGTSVSSVRTQREQSTWFRALAVGGEMVFLHYFGNACVLHAPRSVVQRAWALLATENTTYGEAAAKMAAEYSAESCRKWLDRYGPKGSLVREAIARGETGWETKPAAGWEARAFLARQS